MNPRLNLHQSAGATTTRPTEFQNVKEIHGVIVLEALFNSIYLAYLLKLKLWSYGPCLDPFEILPSTRHPQSCLVLAAWRRCNTCLLLGRSKDIIPSRLYTTLEHSTPAQSTSLASTSITTNLTSKYRVHGILGRWKLYSDIIHFTSLHIIPRVQVTISSEGLPAMV